ncbi:uncharacterized protein LOC115630669 [Scaptodrosophila lebanonensis]|uniref:Uncharacterized protein LOC115630669 n=1 Tax=Drosophila lebanonensis TaxID=7225 RepID=A0A6J2U7M6_DROLE|nr:uncharacterized protein LOC115630669 [Scaptodrosophila lebanonensis]
MEYVTTNMKALSVIESEKRSSSSAWPETPVLNISGKLKPSQKRRKAPLSSAEEVNVNTFPLILSRILLKSDEGPLHPPSKENWLQYVGVLCLFNKISNAHMYHIFCTTEKYVGIDYEKVSLLYKKKPHICEQNRITQPAICARALCLRIRNTFKEYKWNNEGNVFETLPGAHHNVGMISARIHEMGKEELKKLLYYLRFLYATKM